MAAAETKNRMNIGSSSLILIFIVLCLATFGLLSVTNSSGDLKLARKNANAVRTYYEADAQGVEFVRMADRTLAEVMQAQHDPEKQKDMLAEKLGAFYQRDHNIAWTDIAMDFDQALHVELKMDGENPLEIQTWKVYNQKEYAIDDSMPVWTGE